MSIESWTLQAEVMGKGRHIENLGMDEANVNETLI